MQTGDVADRGVVREFHVDEGWGVIDGPAVPGGCWVHFSAIATGGFRQLAAGRHVWFRAEGAEQDGFSFRAVKVWTEDVEPVTPLGSSGGAYRSHLVLSFDQPEGVSELEVDTSVLDPSRAATFPVFEAIVDSFGAFAWGGWMETGGAVVGVSRVCGGAPDQEGPAASRPGVTVWSFAPEHLSGVYSGPAHQAVLAFVGRFAEVRGIPVREAAERLVSLVSSGGALVGTVVDGNRVPGRMFEIAGLGWLVTSVETTHAFAATFFLTSPIVEFQRILPAR